MTPATRKGTSEGCDVVLELETQTFERHRRELLATDRGRFALVAGDSVRGTFETYREAVNAGYTQVGLGPFLVKQILEEDPVHFAALR